MSKDHKEVFICDMGISNLKEITKTTLTTTSNGPKGTIPYMAPELFSRGSRGPAVDVYAFGCLVNEVFGERRVWEGLSGPEIMQKVCGTFRRAPVPPSVAHLPTPIQNVCLTCCELEQKERPSITEMFSTVSASDFL